jgi:MFS family permease
MAQSTGMKTRLGPTKLFNKNFVLLWQGQLVSQIGSQAFSIAMVFWLKQATESGVLMGTMLMFSTLPAVLLSPFAGTFADRHSRRWILIVCDTLSGIAVLSLAAILFLRPDTMDVIIPWMFVVAVVVAILATFFRTAQSAAIPDIVPKDKLAGANSLNHGSVQVSTLIGQGLGGVLYRVLGAPVLFLVDGISYLFSAFSELFIRIPQEIPESTGGWRELARQFKQDTLDGLSYVWIRPGMRNFMIAAALMNFFTAPFIVLLPFYVEDLLKMSADWYGYILAIFGAGSLIGAVLAGSLPIQGNLRGRIILAMMAAFGLLFIVFGTTQSPTIALAISVIIGIFSGFINIHIATIFQLTTPSEIRGRVFGLLATLGGGLMPIGMGLAGILVDVLNKNILPLYIGAGLMSTAVILLVSASRDVREFLAYTPPEKEASASKARNDLDDDTSIQD